MTTGVIITVYNLQEYIAEAIQSVLEQSEQPDRILVINDGSTDASIEVIKQFENQIEIIDNKANQGVLPSIINGLKILNTDIICFLDGDDRWDKDKLKETRNVFRRHKDAMMVTHAYQYMDVNGKVQNAVDITHRNLARISRRSKGNEEIACELLKTSILSYQGVWLGSALSIRPSFVDIGQFERWSLSIWGHALSHQDQPLAAFMILKNPAAKVCYIDRILFHYRVFGENTSGSSSTLAKAMHTLSRSKATLLRTQNAVKLMTNRARELKLQNNKLLEIDYLVSLYQRNFTNAFIIFFRLSAAHWSWRDWLKESARVMGVLILGVNRFLKIK